MFTVIDMFQAPELGTLSLLVSLDHAVGADRAVAQVRDDLAEPGSLTPFGAIPESEWDEFVTRDQGPEVGHPDLETMGPYRYRTG